MKIGEVISIVDELKPNQYDSAIKVKWLAALEQRIINEVVLKHELPVAEDTSDSSDPSDPAEEEIETEDMTEDELPLVNNPDTEVTEWDFDTDLIAPDAYAEFYQYYLMSKIDFMNGEVDRYTNSSIMFNNAYSNFCGWYNKNHKPLTRQIKLW